MPYLSYQFQCLGEEEQDVLIAFLSERNFDAFETDNLVLKAITQNQSDVSELKDLSHLYIGEPSISEIKEINWNKEWESSFQPIEINNKWLVRAHFHEKNPSFQHEIIITPGMAFGTGHHQTTSLVMELVDAMSVKGWDVLDMGTGTGILAIQCAIKGAGQVIAIDNDSNAVASTMDNIKTNGTEEIQVMENERIPMSLPAFDLIIANINRNILMELMSDFHTKSKKSGFLILSGFYKEDLPFLEERAKEINFILEQYLERDNWVAARFKRQA